MKRLRLVILLVLIGVAASFLFNRLMIRESRHGFLIGDQIVLCADGHVYFFVGEALKTMRVRMNEHTDTTPLEDSRTLDELWAYLERFRVVDRR